MTSAISSPIPSPPPETQKPERASRRRTLSDVESLEYRRILEQLNELPLVSGSRAFDLVSALNRASTSASWQAVRAAEVAYDFAACVRCPDLNQGDLVSFFGYARTLLKFHGLVFRPNGNHHFVGAAQPVVLRPPVVVENPQEVNHAPIAAAKAVPQIVAPIKSTGQPIACSPSPVRQEHVAAVERKMEAAEPKKTVIVDSYSFDVEHVQLLASKIEGLADAAALRAAALATMRSIAASREWQKGAETADLFHQYSGPQQADYVAAFLVAAQRFLAGVGDSHQQRQESDCELLAHTFGWVDDGSYTARWHYYSFCLRYWLKCHWVVLAIILAYTLVGATILGLIRPCQVLLSASDNSPLTLWHNRCTGWLAWTEGAQRLRSAFWPLTLLPTSILAPLVCSLVVVLASVRVGVASVDAAELWMLNANRRLARHEGPQPLRDFYQPGANSASPHTRLANRHPILLLIVDWSIVVTLVSVALPVVALFWV